MRRFLLLMALVTGAVTANAANPSFESFYTNHFGVTNRIIYSKHVSPWTTNSQGYITPIINTNFNPQNVKWYSAKGDGVSDDTTAIQNAVNSAAVGASLYVPAGIYQVDAITISKPLVLMGEGVLRFKTDTAAFSLIYIAPGTSNIVVDGITFDGNRANQSVWSEFRHSLQAVDCRNVRIQNCAFVNPIGDCVYLGTAFGAVAPFVGVSDVTIQNCLFEGTNQNRNGVTLTCGQRVSLLGNVFRGMATQVMPGAFDAEPDDSDQFIRNIAIVGNIVEGCRGGFLFPNLNSVPLTNYGGFTITGNTVSHCVGATSDGGVRIWLGSDSVVSGNTFTGITNGQAILIKGDQLQATGNAIAQCKWGVMAQDCAQARISHNTLTNIQGAASLYLLDSKRSLVLGNTVTGWDAGNFGLLLDGDCSDSSVIGNAFNGIVGAIAATSVSATTARLVGIGNSFINCSVNWQQTGVGGFYDNFATQFTADNFMLIGDRIDRRQAGYPLLGLSGAVPNISFFNTLAITNNRLWTMVVTPTQWNLRATEDALGAEGTILAFSRLGAAGYDGALTLANSMTYTVPATTFSGYVIVTNYISGLNGASLRKDGTALTIYPATGTNSTLIVFDDKLVGSTRGSLGFASNGDTNMTINVNNGVLNLNGSAIVTGGSGGLGSTNRWLLKGVVESATTNITVNINGKDYTFQAW